MSPNAGGLGFKTLGYDVTIWPQAKIVAPEVISVGDAVTIDDFVFLMGGAGVDIGSFVHIASFTSITGGGKLIIEDFAGISSGVRVFTGNEDYSGGSMTNPTVPFPYRSPIRGSVRIGKHAVIGANTVILPDVTINEGVVISPNSVVISECAPWTLYVGNPARPVKQRPSERILMLERQLRAEAYAPDGAYIPLAHRRRRGDNVP